jgi:transglutaminase/protease-like cytokinesis protein 3
MRLGLILITALGLSINLNAQKNNEYSAIDKVMVQIPDSLTKTTQGIADYVKLNFSKSNDQSRAIFIWIAKNIQYDIDNMFAINFYQKTNEIIDKVLSTRKGICMSYAELFNDIANKAGVKTYVISGYTKQNGFVDYIPHAWCASMIDSVWFLFDPTWGSGYIQNGKFVKQINNYYYKTKPEQIVKSHMPFDPLWQFLNYPITNQEFYEGKTQVNNKKDFFNFEDTLQRFEKQSEIEQLIGSSNRIEKNGVKNSLVFDRLQHNKREIEYYNNKKVVDNYNSAVNSFNSGINLLNVFIDYRNKQFTPKRPDAEIKQMVDTVDYLFNQARVQLNTLKNPDLNLATSITQLNKSLNDATVNLNDQKAFVDKYLKAGKLTRKSLFTKYTWFGIPLN